ncbi:hypothetical protein Scep_020751 [Stephania cephalantha]|uniref:Transmembrane protein n=1 Tax=Stephania cephalantha TaxID=152367 RepID=A0AAP0IDH0_9MAGN
MEANFISSLQPNLTPSFFTNSRPLHNQVFFLSTSPNHFKFYRSISSSTSNSNKVEDENGLPIPPVPPPVTPPDTVEIRFRRGSRRRSRQQQKGSEGGSANKPPTPPPKDWESMTLAEKALELYVGEKGLLFWLNKFAYASIFIIIGGWILFRFVGPSIGLYQLDSPPLSPTSVFK